ncbi:MAG: ABC transporter ATP-binding protein [Bryobacterales bacterium]|nr:ABC transporter ATP-binding protein [Bryobacterales bacterium]
MRNTPAPSAVSVAGLRRHYGATEALRGVTFDVDAGQIFGLLGPNGAGKTTALECILGLRQPDGGVIHIHGLDLRTHAAQAKLLTGAQLQGAALQDKITPRQALELFGAFYADPCPAGELLGQFDLEAKADLPFATLSGGQRQRLFLALALVNRPTLLVLDEPTAGLDPQARRTLRSMIRELQAEGRTVLLSTHDLEEAGQLCDQLAILDQGRIIATAPPAELIAGAQAPSRLTVRTAPPLARAVIEALPGVLATTHTGDTWTLDAQSPNRLLAELVQRAGEAGAELLAIELRRPSLEDVFLELTGRPWAGAAEPGDAS